MTNSAENREALRRQNEREAHMRALANQLYFIVEKTGTDFTLTRTVDVSPPERAEGLTLDQAEELLETWKLRCHGA